eukprot:99704-Chlamydomonas_euryale.AAC.2
MCAGVICAGGGMTRCAACCLQVAVLSKGTMVDAEMVASRPDASYIIAVAEAPARGGGGGGGQTSQHALSDVVVGICAVDAASGHVVVGQFADDEVWNC